MRFINGENRALLERWKELSNTIGGSFNVEIAGKRVQGVAKDIEVDGSLIVETLDGKRHRIYSGDLEAINNE